MLKDSQKRAMKNYNEKIKTDPEKLEKVREYRRNYQRAYMEKVKEDTEKLSKIQTKQKDRYVEWKDKMLNEKPEEYKEYLTNSRLRYWRKIKEEKTEADFEKLMVKLKRNRPDFHKKLTEIFDIQQNE